MLGKRRVLDVENARSIDRVRPEEIIRVGKPDVLALMVSKVKVVATQGILDPLGNSNQGRSVDVAADSFIHTRVNDGVVRTSLCGDGH